MENYVKEEVADPEGDEYKAQEGLSQSQEDFSVSIGSHMYHP